MSTKKEEEKKIMKFKEYDKCKHLLLVNRYVNEWEEGRTYRYYFCMKCGLNSDVLRYQRSYWNSVGQIQYDYFVSHNLKYYATDIFWGLGGKKIGDLCNSELAIEICARIKKAHPDIDDETLVSYFRTALSDIRNIPVNKEREESRVKRLGLTPHFNAWNMNAVIEDYM